MCLNGQTLARSEYFKSAPQKIPFMTDKHKLNAHGAMDRRINPSWGGPIELFLIPASAPRLV